MKTFKIIQDIGKCTRIMDFETKKEAFAYGKDLGGFVTIEETDESSFVNILFRNWRTKGHLTVVTGSAA